MDKGSTGESPTQAQVNMELQNRNKQLEQQLADLTKRDQGPTSPTVHNINVYAQNVTQIMQQGIDKPASPLPTRAPNIGPSYGSGDSGFSGSREAQMTQTSFPSGYEMSGQQAGFLYPGDTPQYYPEYQRGRSNSVPMTGDWSHYFKGPQQYGQQTYDYGQPNMPQSPGVQAGPNIPIRRMSEYQQPNIYQPGQPYLSPPRLEMPSPDYYGHPTQYMPQPQPIGFESMDGVDATSFRSTGPKCNTTAVEHTCSEAPTERMEQATMELAPKPAVPPKPVYSPRSLLKRQKEMYDIDGNNGNQVDDNNANNEGRTYVKQTYFSTENNGSNKMAKTKYYQAGSPGGEAHSKLCGPKTDRHNQLMKMHQIDTVHDTEDQTLYSLQKGRNTLVGGPRRCEYDRQPPDRALLQYGEQITEGDSTEMCSTAGDAVLNCEPSNCSCCTCRGQP